MSEDGALHRTAAEDGIAETTASPCQGMQIASGVVDGLATPSLMLDMNGDASTVEHELEALQHVVAVLAEQLSTLSAEVASDDDFIPADSPEHNGAIPDWESPPLGGTGASATHLARWYVRRLIGRAAAAECLGAGCDPVIPSALSTLDGAACEAEGAQHLATELRALEECFNRAVSTAAACLKGGSSASGFPKRTAPAGLAFLVSSV